MRIDYLDLASTASLQLITNSSFINHATILCCIFWSTNSVMKQSTNNSVQVYCRRSDTYFQNIYIFKNTASWKVTLCFLIEIYRDFSGHSASRNMKRTRSFKMVVNLYQNTRLHMQRQSNLPRQPVWNSDVIYFLPSFLELRLTACRM